MSTANRYQHIKSTKPVVGKARKLKDLMIKSDNRICADCGAPDPKWASANIGVFLCLKCGDVHKALGPDISKVLSVTLDDWSDSDIDSMVEVGGNSHANSIYEAFLPKDRPKPKPDSTMEYRTKFIRAKYETQDFLKPSLRISSRSSFKSTTSVKSVDSNFSSTSRKDVSEDTREFVGELNITLVKGTNLAVRDMLTSDPYVVLTLGGQFCSKNSTIGSNCIKLNRRHLEDSLDDWFDEQLENYLDDDYLVFDCPGQIELFTHVPVLRNFVEHLKRKIFNVCAVYLLDSQLELPHINILSKMDLVSNKKDVEVDDYSMVSFIPLDLRKESSIQYVLSSIDTCIQYGEDADVKVRDFEEDED
ncbi:ADP-ribosylation factor GTPase-activating protein AGD12 [Zea mays]|uniref:ADP-ribosylation factor GTPase-activating protein AGD12 n=2 Tax=Zea mays TaxID=4577 RepID=A0A1D6EMB9_MAIZE|nr:ADP-ribosylation factor GTPase-activating protein AGD12 [Zea mays]